MNKNKNKVIVIVIFAILIFLMKSNTNQIDKTRLVKEEKINVTHKNSLINNKKEVSTSKDNKSISNINKKEVSTSKDNKSISNINKKEFESDLLIKILTNTSKNYIYDDIEELITSFNKDTDVINIVELLLSNKRTRETIIDMFPSFLSSDEFEIIFERNYNNFSSNEKQIILTMYANNSIINAKNPYESSFMGKMIKENINMEKLSQNTQLFLSLELDAKENENFSDSHSESFASKLIKDKPTTSNVTDLYYWINSNLNIKNDEDEKIEFMIEAMEQLSLNEKKELLEIAPNLNIYLH